MVFQFVMILNDFNTKLDPNSDFLHGVNFNYKWAIFTLLLIQHLFSYGKGGIQKVAISLTKSIVIVCQLSSGLFFNTMNNLDCESTISYILIKLYSSVFFIYQIIVKDFDGNFACSTLEIISYTIWNSDDSFVNILN